MTPPSLLLPSTRRHASSGTKTIEGEAEPTKTEGEEVEPADPTRASVGEAESADKGDGSSIELEKNKALVAPALVRDVGSEILHLRRVNEALCERVEYMERCQLGSLVSRSSI